MRRARARLVQYEWRDRRAISLSRRPPAADGSDASEFYTARHSFHQPAPLPHAEYETDHGLPLT